MTTVNTMSATAAAPKSPFTMTDAHEQWAKRPADQRFETLSALRDSVHSRRMRSRAVDVDTARLHVDLIDNRLVLNSAISPCEPTHWSFGQLAGNVGAPSAYLRTLPKPMVRDLLNHGLSTTKRETMKFMTLSAKDEEPTNTLQAVTSPSYGRIWDADCVDAVQRIVERSGGKFFNPKAYSPGQYGGEAKGSGLYASDHDCFMFMIDGGSLLDIAERAKLHRGFILMNSETGARTMQLITFLFNAVCGNHYIYGAQNINRLIIRHTAGGPGRFDSEVTPLLEQYANQTESTERVMVQKALGYALPKEEKDLLALVAPFKITRSELAEAKVVATREDGQFASLWDLTQGLTASARDYAFIDARVDLERRAGALLKLVGTN